MAATTHILSVGTRASGSDISVTISSVTGTNPYTVTLDAPVPATVNIGDRLDDGTNSYKITGISGSDLTVTEAPFGTPGTGPATGARHVRRAYSTLAAAHTALPSNLVTADEQWEFELYNDGEFSSMDITTKTTDSTHKIIFRAAAGHAFYEHADFATNPLAYNQTYGVGLSADVFLSGVIALSTPGYIEFYGLQVKGVGGGTRAFYANTPSGSQHWYINKCLFQAVCTGTTAAVVVSASTSLIEDCIIINNANGSGLRLLEGAVANHVTIVTPSTTSNTNYGVQTGYGNPVCTNCAVFGFGEAFHVNDSTYGGACDTNATDYSSAPGTTVYVSLTYANQFVDVDADWHIISGADLIDVGSGSHGTDISGATRDANPDIGAEEYVAAPTAITPAAADLGMDGESIVLSKLIVPAAADAGMDAEAAVVVGGTLVTPAAADLGMDAERAGVSVTTVVPDADFGMDAEAVVISKLIVPAASDLGMDAEAATIPGTVHVIPAAADLGMDGETVVLSKLVVPASSDLGLDAEAAIILGSPVVTPAAADLGLDSEGAISFGSPVIAPAAADLGMDAEVARVGGSITGILRGKLALYKPTFTTVLSVTISE